MDLQDFKDIFNQCNDFDKMSRIFNDDCLSILSTFDVLDLFRYVTNSKKQFNNFVHFHYIYEKLNFFYQKSIQELENTNFKYESDKDYQLQWIHVMIFQTEKALSESEHSDSLLLNKMLHNDPGKFEYVKKHPNYQFNISHIVESYQILLR